jgi:hypothetical protein
MARADSFWYNSRMASTIYETATIQTVDGVKIYLTPLKIKYLRQFMQEFDDLKLSTTEEESVQKLISCAAISMQQYMPELSSIAAVEDNFDIKTVYKILEISAGIKLNSPNESKEINNKKAKASGPGWDELDLAQLESEVFLLGIWKDYEELESSLSMPELTSVLNAKREDDYNHKKFLAAIQGVDLDKQSGRASNAWEDMKARVFSGGKAKTSDDIVSMQGVNAQMAGFGIGMGLDYEDLG